MVTFKVWIVGYEDSRDGVMYRSGGREWVNLTPLGEELRHQPFVVTVDDPKGELWLRDFSSTPQWGSLLMSPVTDFGTSKNWTWDVRRNIVSKGAPLDVKLLVLIGGLVLLGVVITQKGKIPIPAPPV